MVTAILYTTNSGYTKAYAELMSKLTGLPAYNTANSIPPAVRGKDVIYLGWLMAGGVQGFKKVRERYAIKALCPVGMAPKEQDQVAGIRKKYGLGILPIFYLQGGFSMEKLTGIYRFMMKMMCKKILADLPKTEERTEDQQAMYEMCVNGRSFVSEENLSEVLTWFQEQKEA